MAELGETEPTMRPVEVEDGASLLGRGVLLFKGADWSPRGQGEGGTMLADSGRTNGGIGAKEIEI